MMSWRQFVCGLTGHERVLHTAGDTLTLRCAACAHDTPGWSTGAPRYKLTAAGIPERHRIARAAPLALVRNRSRKMRR